MSSPKEVPDPFDQFIDDGIKRLGYLVQTNDPSFQRELAKFGNCVVAEHLDEQKELEDQIRGLQREIRDLKRRLS